nr:tyrosine-type recombinase/integrase [bacterium]
MANLTMVFIFEEILSGLSELGLAEGSIRQYTRYFSKMQGFFTEGGAPEYSERILDEYWAFVTQREIPYSQKYISSLWKSVCIVKKYVAGDGVSCSFLTRGSQYNPGAYFQDIIDSSIESLLLEGSTRTFYSTVTRKFCCQLEKKGIASFSDLGLSDVSQIMTKFGQSNPNSMGLVTSNINKFLRYLNNVGICNVQIESSLYVPCKKKKIIPSFSADELRKMLGACDRNTKIGKRDYAILLLAASCGLRGSDISKMNLTDIDWERYVIRLTQKKTGIALSIPMPAESGNAVADYILKGRPKETGHTRVFLTSRAPLRPVEQSAIDGRLLIICGKASIPKLPGRCFHSLRRSAGTFMAASQVPITTISQVLGHSDCKSADRYISANP